MTKRLERGAGILLPISSLPSPYGIGTMGKEAYSFIDKLVLAGQKYWQVLPVGPTSYGDSPYQSFSTFAGNPYFIDIENMIDEGLLEKSEVEWAFWGGNEEYVEYDAIYNSRYPLLKKAFERWTGSKSFEYEKFIKDNSEWLEDYALFMAVKESFEQVEWSKWDDDIKNRKPKAIETYSKKYADEIEFWKFLQFRFFKEWNRLKEYANSKGISIIGDIPIYVAMDSADVWVNPNLYQLDKDKNPKAVAGCPPDAFSDEGQRWGNPLYDWNEMEKDGFTWWKQRIEAATKLYDVTRIDHFIGVCRYYVIPADKTAKEGHFAYGPGRMLTKAINEALGDAKIIAEDLGVKYEAVDALLEQEGYPGMKVLMFAFDGTPTNEHLPYNVEKNSVMYIGTHDNDTFAGYLKTLPAEQIKRIKSYVSANKDEDIVKQTIKTAYLSVADTCIIQMQDILEKSNDARTNYPSTIGTNWKWRLQEGEFGLEQIEMLKKLVILSGR